MAEYLTWGGLVIWVGIEKLIILVILEGDACSTQLFVIRVSDVAHGPLGFSVLLDVEIWFENVLSLFKLIFRKNSKTEWVENKLSLTAL